MAPGMSLFRDCENWATSSLRAFYELRKRAFQHFFHITQRLIIGAICERQELACSLDQLDL
jgi:hypothetical protein